MNHVAVTTSADRAAAAAIPFTLAELQPVLLPCIEIEPADDEILRQARTSAGSADLVVVSSRRTIDLLWPDGPLPDVRFAAVGRVTARAIENRGAEVAIVGRGGSVRLAEVLAPLVAGKAVVWPHARGAEPGPLGLVAQRARAFTAPTIYASVPIAPPPDPVDVVTFASPSAVAGWQLARSLDNVTIAVIGRTTAQAVELSGAPEPIVAPSPTFQSLAETVANYLGVVA